MAESEKVPGGSESEVPAAAGGTLRRIEHLCRAVLGNAIPGPPDARAGRPARPRHRVSIHVLVLVLIVALVAPAIAFLGYIVEQKKHARELEISERGARVADDIANRLEQEFAATDTMLAVFGSSGWLEAGELQLLHRRASRALAGTQRHLIVLDESFDQLLNTRVPFGAPLGRSSDAETAAAVLETGRPAVSNVFFGRVARAAVFNVLHPVTLPDGRKRVLILTRNTDSVARMLNPASATGGWSYAVLDGAGQIVARAGASGDADGAVPAACMNEITGFIALSTDEAERYLFLRSIDGSPWKACVWASPADLAPDALAWTDLFTATVIWLGVAMAAAVLLSTAISRAIARTARIGEALGSGRDVPESPSIIAEIDNVRRSLAKAAAERIRNDQRMELLLREAAHRAKNQIAMTVSLIHLSARTAGTARELKDDVTARLMALGRSVDALTGRSPDAAPLSGLVDAQLHPFLDGRRDRVSISGDEVLLSERAAQSLTLVLHELATNASKHGAWSRPDGRLTIAWEKTSESLVLDWSELGSCTGTSDHEGFGTTLVNTLVEKTMGGRVERRAGDGGFGCRIVLPLATIAPAA